MSLTAVYMQLPEGYIAFVEELPGANTQGATLEEARKNLQEAVALVLEANREFADQSIGTTHSSRSADSKAIITQAPTACANTTPC